MYVLNLFAVRATRASNDLVWVHASASPREMFRPGDTTFACLRAPCPLLPFQGHRRPFNKASMLVCAGTGRFLDRFPGFLGFNVQQPRPGSQILPP
jgi:hypothetical protein